MSDAQKPLIIKDFQKAIADSPHLGHANMRNLDIEIYPGALKPQKKNLPLLISANTSTFTFNSGTGNGTAAATLVTTAETATGVSFNGAAVYFTTTGALPAGLSLNTVYFLIYVDGVTFGVAGSRAQANTATRVAITDNGTGVHTVHPIAPGTIKTIKRDQNSSNYYAIDSNGRVWSTQGSNYFRLLLHASIENVTGALNNEANSGNGLELFGTSDGSATYLFVFRNAAIDVINVFNDAAINSPSWTDAWQAMNSSAGSGNRHFSLVGQDNLIYFTDGRYVGSIMEKVGQVFAPGTAGTYTYNNRALTLPQYEYAYCLEELGINLLTGGKKFNKIYPWDRSSNSFTLPLLVPETGIYEMRNLGSIVYIFAGTKGNIYSTQGTYVKHFKALSQYVTNQPGTAMTNPMVWGGSAVRNGAVLIGMSTQTTANNGTYIVYPDGRWLMDSTPWGGAQITTAIYAENDFYFAGYAGQIDLPDSNRVTSLGAVYESALFNVGDKTHKAAFSIVEVQLARPVTVGSSQIKVSWRGDDDSAWEEITTFTSNTTSTSFKTDAGLIDLENIQIQVAMDGNVEVDQIRLFP